jgi:hypothetical protein
LLTTDFKLNGAGFELFGYNLAVPKRAIEMKDNVLHSKFDELCRRAEGMLHYGFLPGEYFFIDESSDRLRDYLCDAMDRSFETAPAPPLPSPE